LLGTGCFAYDVGGNVVSSDDGHGHTSTSAYSTATQYSAPDTLTPAGDNHLATSLTYTGFLGLTSVAAPNSTATFTYDTYARPKNEHFPLRRADDAHLCPDVEPAHHHRENDHHAEHHGNEPPGGKDHSRRVGPHHLGRTIKVETSDDDGNNKLTVDTVYDSCACSPIGKVKQVSRPYAPGATVSWTVYTYDALGRTTRIDLPGATGAITYAYAGNTVTVTDPAGKWKKYVTDGMGNLTSVTEQRPAGESADHVTNYS